jgi:vacuolar-type H+-ATPase subunit I/STV1
MRLYQLTVPKDDAWTVMNEFGDIGYAMFINLNKDESPYNLPYTTQIKLCEEAERKLNYLLDQCKKHYVDVFPPENVKAFLSQLTKIKDNKRKAINLLLDEIQKDINQQESFVDQQNQRLKETEATLANFRDAYQVFNVALKMIPQLNQKAKTDLEKNPEAAPFIEGDNTIKIERIAGVVETSEVERLRRLVFRATKAKSFMHVEQFLHPEMEGVKSINPKSVYIITFQDGQTIKDKITRICDSFTGQRYDLPETADLYT